MNFVIHINNFRYQVAWKIPAKLEILDASSIKGIKLNRIPSDYY